MTNFYLREALIDLSDEMNTESDDRIKSVISSAVYHLSVDNIKAAQDLLRGIRKSSSRVSRVQAMLALAEAAYHKGNFILIVTRQQSFIIMLVRHYYVTCYLLMFLALSIAACNSSSALAML